MYNFWQILANFVNKCRSDVNFIDSILFYPNFNWIPACSAGVFPIKPCSLMKL